MRLIPARTLLPPALLALALAVAAWWALPADPVRALRRPGLELRAVTRSAAPELGTRIERWRMITVGGDTLSGLWRAAAPGAAHPWTVVLLGGLVTGERATLLVPEQAGANLLAVDWPWREARRMPWWRVVLRLPAIRDAALSSPAVLALGVEAAARTPGVDPGRLALVGVSLGVPPAVAALRLTRRPAALALVHGAADLSLLLRRGLEREGVPPMLAVPLAALGARLIRPLEPALHAAAVAERPVLLINAAPDPLLPAAAVRRLHRLFPAADVRWRRGLHGARDRRAVVAEVTGEVEAWLARPPA